jgi:hypothetical protein
LSHKIRKNVYDCSKNKKPREIRRVSFCCGIGRNQHPSGALDFTDFDDMPKKFVTDLL